MVDAKRRLTGKVLRTTREKLGVSLVKASDDTRIKQRILEAFESDEQVHLSSSYKKALLRSYANYLGLSISQPKQKSNQYQPEKKLKRNSHSLFGLVATSSLAAKLFASLFIGALLVYGLLLVYRLFAPPGLDIIQPDSIELRTQASSIEIIGQTSPSADLFVGNDVVLLEPDGRFKTIVPLRSGLNEIEVRSVNALGRIATRHISVVSIPQ